MFICICFSRYSPSFESSRETIERVFNSVLMCWVHVYFADSLLIKLNSKYFLVSFLLLFACFLFLGSTTSCCIHHTFIKDQYSRNRRVMKVLWVNFNFHWWTLMGSMFWSHDLFTKHRLNFIEFFSFSFSTNNALDIINLSSMFTSKLVIASRQLNLLPTTKP